MTAEESCANCPMPVWVQHPRYHHHEVSSDGRVRVFSRWVAFVNGAGRTIPAHEMAQQADPRGYFHVGLSGYEHGRRKRVRVHVLVCEAFHGPRPDGGVTRHLNGDHTDNRAENLAWGTQADNIRDQVRHGTHPEASKTHCKYGHEFTPENTCRGPRDTRGCRTCNRRRYKESVARSRARLTETVTS